MIPAHYSLIRMLAYFEIFSFPLQAEELIHILPEHDKRNLYLLLEELACAGLVHHTNGYYALSKNTVNQNKRPEITDDLFHFFSQAKKYSKKIWNFPFVRGIYVSGSLSKGWVEKNSDIDYFIITEPGRLWLCRTLLALYKKTFLFNSRKYFCVNYFVDTGHLVIPDKNLFTATEICFLKPIAGYELYLRFVRENAWANQFYPGWEPVDRSYLADLRKGKGKTRIEKLLSGRLGEWLDRLAFRVTLGYWKRKFKNFDADDFDLNLRSRKHVSKHHPQGFQAKILLAFQEKIRKFEEEHNVTVP